MNVICISEVEHRAVSLFTYRTDIISVLVGLKFIDEEEKRLLVDHSVKNKLLPAVKQLSLPNNRTEQHSYFFFPSTAVVGDQADE